MNNNVKKYLFISSGIILSWVCVEYFIDAYHRKTIKRILKNNINSIYYTGYKSFYYKSLTNIQKELENTCDIEREHIKNSFQKTFSSIDSMDSIVDKISLYKNYKSNGNITRLLKLENMLWYPYLFRVLFSLMNEYFIFSCKLKWKVKVSYFRTNYIYEIVNKDNQYSKIVVLFNGLGGILSNYDKLFEFLLKKKYKIIIPFYGPTQACLNYNFDCHEGQFYNDIHDYLFNNNYYTIDIIAWSLGGILYKGFEIYNKKYHTPDNLNINIDKIILFEPLLGSRGCIDTYFSKLRKTKNTLSILNCMTSEKYKQYNNIFTYFIHSIVGYSTATSFGYFTSIELKNSYINPKRFIFLSSDDIVINDHIDNDLIKSNFHKENVFKRIGYHGGWLQSSKLEETLRSII